VKRIFLFLLTNIAVMAVITIVLQVTGLNQHLGGQGSMAGLLAASAVIGFAGSIISLLMSKKMAAMSVGAQIITQPQGDVEHWLVETVRRQANQANIGMPEVAIYDSPDVNAFATGANKNNALVAVSTGLLRSMSKSEAEAVLAHEISHVANGDMVTLTLIQGVVNTFVFFFSRIIGNFVDRVILKNEDDGPGIGFFVSSLVAQIFLGFLATIIVMWFSRQREFRADAGGANLSGRQNMINALKRLQSAHEPEHMPEKVAALGISGKRGGMMRLFMTHPPLEERIARLEASVTQG
jgi:heat shock protein HtpX